MIDARGLSCPLPVIRTKNEVDKNHPDSMEVMVDNQTAVQNISRFAASAGYAVSCRETDEDEYLLTLTNI